MPSLEDQNIEQNFAYDEFVQKEIKDGTNKKTNNRLREALEKHFISNPEGNRVKSFVIKNEQANNDKANVTAAERFSNDFIYAKDGWHEIFQFCLANGMDRVLEQYPHAQHNTGIKAVKLFIQHLIGAKLDSSGSL